MGTKEIHVNHLGLKVCRPTCVRRSRGLTLALVKSNTEAAATIESFWQPAQCLRVDVSQGLHWNISGLSDSSSS